MDNIVIKRGSVHGKDKINIDVAKNKWNFLWVLYEQRTHRFGYGWKLVKYVKKYSDITTFELNVSTKQAKELINQLNLISERNLFTSSFSWRRKEDIEYLNELRIKNIVKSNCCLS